eukprot:TRINITY_DN19056_c0_g1_i2.p1 TRINITY_DN19056_c0_g1~~TRINITY_DN19056_c0_g1_i2.p1  ORF type:complete len:564 (+),score=165.85 TRINITY_DN19056_c0_g1_i2:32-1723(+)
MHNHGSFGLDIAMLSSRRRYGLRVPAAAGVLCGCALLLFSQLPDVFIAWRRNPSGQLSRVTRHVAERDARYSMSPVHNEFKRALVRSAHIDEEAVQMACASLAIAVMKGNHYQVEALMVVLRSMMPPTFGAEKIRGPPKDATIEKADLIWSEHDYMDGPEENLRVLQGFEAEYAMRVANSEEGFRDPKVLEGAMDLAVAYLKNYAVDKADAMFAAIKPYCMERGLPWDVKWLQDCATLRCKQARQPEAAVLLEEVAARTPPHPATLINLGTVYNMMREHEKAQEYFEAAMEVAGHEEPEKDDLWNMGIAKKHLGQYDEALPMLVKALDDWKRDEPEDDVTIAKLHDTVGSCYDLMGRPDDAVEHFSSARMLFGRSIGADSPLYGSACEGLTKSLMHAGRHQEAFDRLEETFLNNAEKDAIHPTPLFELLGYALEDLVGPGHLDPDQLGRLEWPIETAVKNMIHRGLDQDGNAGVVFERMAQVLLRCGMAKGDADQQKIAARRRKLARSLLERAAPLCEATTKSGEADLTGISAVINMEMQMLDSQDALYRQALNPAEAPPLQR